MSPVASLLDLLGSALLPKVLTALDAVDARLLSASESDAAAGGGIVLLPPDGGGTTDGSCLGAN
jgi:hypothetical protein